MVSKGISVVHMVCVHCSVHGPRHVWTGSIPAHVGIPIVIHSLGVVLQSGGPTGQPIPTTLLPVPKNGT